MNDTARPRPQGNAKLPQVSQPPFEDGPVSAQPWEHSGWLGPWLKGFPAAQAPLPLADVASRGWTLAELPTPLAVVRRGALVHNIAWMQRFAAERGVQLAPHGKTTMSPQLFRRQLAAGAWGLTFANVHQLRLGLAAGARRALIANQLVSAADLAELLALRRQYAGAKDLELAFFVDSQAQLDLLAAHWAGLGSGEARLDVLIELGSTRCGQREHEPALALARALQCHPALRLRGIGFYEGLQVVGESEPDRALMQQWQSRVEALLAAIEAESLLDEDARPLWLSGGGSALFDLVAPVIAQRPGRLGLLRSGCYVCHDQAHYGRLVAPINARLGSPLGTDGLRPALEVWAEVLSAPEPGLALLNVGRRDVSFDQTMPVPVWHVQGGQRHAAPDGWQVNKLNDQHAYLCWDPAECDGPTVGDRIALGPSHPCTTFDKWAWLAVVDDDDRVVDAITTQFC